MIALKRLSPIPVPRLARFLAVIAIAMAAGHLVQSLAARKPAIKATAVTKNSSSYFRGDANNE